jgi:ATP-binding cassette subfamily F protein uup
MKFKKASEALVSRQTALAEAEDLWLELSEKAEAG